MQTKTKMNIAIKQVFYNTLTSASLHKEHTRPRDRWKQGWAVHEDVDTYWTHHEY